MSILLTECNDIYFRDLAARLLAINAPVKYIATIFPELYSKNPVFKKATLLDERNYHLSDYIENINVGNPNALSKQDILENRDLESLYLSITDRLTFYPKNVNDRKQRYYELLLYWKTFLKNNSIGTVIFPRVPHLGYGNIIYVLAKSMGIKVLIIRETIFDDSILITECYDDFQKVPKTYKSDLTIKELKKQIGNNFDNIFNKPSQLMQINSSDNSVAMNSNKQSFMSSLFNMPTIKAALTMLHNPFERFVGTPIYMEPPTSWFGYYIMVFKYYLRYQATLSYYNSISELVDFKKKYIYMALHYQPERTSMPEGGVFENQRLMIDILAKSLPTGWYLYVKEHPFQFTRTDIRKMNFRDSHYYYKMKQYSNLKLVSFNVSSQDLIKHCVASVTITGSTGWETLLAKKPVITFAPSSWYSPCNSCYVVSSLEECKAAIKIIQIKSKAEVEKDVLKYWLYIRNKFIESDPSIELARVSKRPYDFLINNLADALIKRI